MGDRLLEPQAALRDLGLDGAVAAAAGPVYRGPSDHGGAIVHGGAVNRAAKLCAVQAPGGLALDASLARPAGPRAPAAGAVVGREAEAARARAWLAAGAPRMVIISGEAGVGKTHLMRAILAEGGPAEGGSSQRVFGRLAGDRGSAMHAGWADYATAQTLLALDQPHEAWARLLRAEDHPRGGPTGNRCTSAWACGPAWPGGWARSTRPSRRPSAAGP
jgi:hypothetical protein